MTKAERGMIRRRFHDQGLKLTKRSGSPLMARPKGGDIIIQVFFRWSEAAIRIDGFEWGRRAQ